MDIQKEREAFQKFCEENFDFENHEQTYFDEKTQCYENEMGEDTESINMAWQAWQQARKMAVPDGYVLTKKHNTIGNPNVDWSQAPDWANWWLKDGYSNKYWWSSKRPTKDNDLGCFVWSGDYSAEEAPSFDYDGSWDKSMTSKKSML